MPQYRKKGLPRVVLTPKNSSGYRGVAVRKGKGHTYDSTIVYNGVKWFLGSGDDPVLLAKAYDIAARKFFGEKAAINFPDFYSPDRKLSDLIPQKSNSSEYYGIRKREKNGKIWWEGSIGIGNGDRIWITKQDYEIQAAKEYDRISYKHFGRKGKLNFPEDYGLPLREKKLTIYDLLG